MGAPESKGCLSHLQSLEHGERPAHDRAACVEVTGTLVVAGVLQYRFNRSEQLGIPAEYMNLDNSAGGGSGTELWPNEGSG